MNSAASQTWSKSQKIRATWKTKEDVRENVAKYVVGKGKGGGGLIQPHPATNYLDALTSRAVRLQISK